MAKTIAVIAPHPDDETLGCGGTLLRHIQEGDQVHWLILTEMTQAGGFSTEQILKRQREIKQVTEQYRFRSIQGLQWPATFLDTVPLREITSGVHKYFQEIQPEVIYVPYRGDAHTDHRIVFDAVAAAGKWFRQSGLRRILAYETLSETELGIDPGDKGFRPNVFVDIGEFLEKKIEILKIYAGEVGEFPFPRSIDAVNALAAFRGAAAGCRAAEAFMLLKEIM
ncbi:MAG: PIG-L family deacetylase [Desulfobacteraceae bacterium]|nr:MAG: PIG-L family deacetylase [Desulfobacteraceae bacterium]